MKICELFQVNLLIRTRLIKMLFKVLKTCAFLTTDAFLCFSEQVFRRTTLRGGSITVATFKMKLFVIIVNGFQPLTVITKSSILDVAAVLDPPLTLGECFLVLCLFPVVPRKSYKTTEHISTWKFHIKGNLEKKTRHEFENPYVKKVNLRKYKLIYQSI